MHTKQLDGFNDELEISMAEEQEAPKGKNKLLIIIIAVVVLLLGGGGAAFF